MTERGGGCAWLDYCGVGKLDRDEPRGLCAAPASEQLFAAQAHPAQASALEAGRWALCALAGGAPPRSWSEGD
jgi:hypothetical protein